MPSFTLNGQSTPAIWESLDEAQWPDHAKAHWKALEAKLVAAGYRIVGRVNYAEPRPYRNIYDQGTDRHYIGASVTTPSGDRDVAFVEYYRCCDPNCPGSAVKPTDRPHRECSA